MPWAPIAGVAATADPHAVRALGRRERCDDLKAQADVSQPARASAESNTAPAGRDSLARLVQAASPADRRQMPRIISLDLAVAPHLAGSLVHCRQRVRPLLRVRTDHDHMTVPSFG